MSEPLPENLSLLYSGFGQAAIDAILPGDSFHVEDVEFVCKYAHESTANCFYIVKNLALVERYRQLCERFTGATIVELGIAEGGSTALLALLARPRKVIAVDLEPTPLRALAEFIEARGLQDVIRPHYGIDQADVAGLGDLLDTELGHHPIDLVFDDCSHQFDATRASFETIFPRLRPDGLYVIEDWNLDHVMLDAVRQGLSDTSAPDHEERLQQFREQMVKASAGEAAPRRDPLSRMAIELVVARSSVTEAIAEVSVDEFWIVVRRGTAELDPSTFRLSDHYTDHFGFVPPRRETPG